MDNNKKNVPEIRFPGFTDPWEQRKLGDIVDRVTRKNTNNESELPLTISAQYGLIDQMEFFGKRIASRDISGYYLLFKGEFAYNKSTSGDAPWGAVKRLDRYENGAVSTLYITFAITDPKQTDSDFIACYYDTDLWHKGVQAVAAEGARNHGLLNIAPADFFNTTLMMPVNIEEQKAIGRVLNRVDNLITLHQRKCDELKIYKKGLLQQMFPQPGESIPRVRFPGFTDPWEQRKFSDVFRGLQNNTLSRADLNYDQGDIKNVHYGDVLIKFGEYIDVSSAELPYINDSSIETRFAKSLLKDGDIIIADTAEDETVGKCCEITNSKGMKLLSGLHTIAVRPQQKYGAKFLGYYLNSKAYHSQLLPLMQGIKVTSISKGALQETNLIVPASIEEQSKIGECLSHIDDLITLHQRKCDMLKTYKKGLLQKMFV